MSPGWFLGIFWVSTPLQFNLQPVQVTSNSPSHGRSAPYLADLNHPSNNLEEQCNTSSSIPGTSPGAIGVMHGKCSAWTMGLQKRETEWIIQIRWNCCSQMSKNIILLTWMRQLQSRWLQWRNWWQTCKCYLGEGCCMPRNSSEQIKQLQYINVWIKCSWGTIANSSHVCFWCCWR